MSVTYDRVFTHDDAQALLTKQGDIKDAINGLTTAVSNQTTNAVDRSTAQSIDGVKTFTSAPLITDTIPDSENSSKAATTSWVETVFFSKLVAKLAATTATSISSLSTSSLFYRMLSWALTAAGVQYNFTNSSAWYICLGSLFGGLIIQGGRCADIPLNGSWTNFYFPINFYSVNYYRAIACPYTVGAVTSIAGYNKSQFQIAMKSNDTGNGVAYYVAFGAGSDPT